MKLVIGIVRPEKANDVLEALYRAEVRGVSMSRVQGHGGELDRVETYRGTTVRMGLSEKVRIEIAVSDDFVDATITALCDAGRTGEVGDGKIFVVPLERAVRIRTGETDAGRRDPGGCVMDVLVAQAAKIDTGDTAWMLTATALVLLMTPALGLFYAGLVRSKNTLNTFMMCIAAIAVAIVTWAAVGYSFAFDGGQRASSAASTTPSSRTSTSSRSTGAATIPHVVFFAFQATFVHHHHGADLGRGGRADALQRLPDLRRRSGRSLVYAVLAHWALRPGLAARTAARSTSPAASPSRWAPGSRRSRRRSSSARARTTAARRCFRTTPSTCCSARGCCGSAGSASTAAAGSARARTRQLAFVNTLLTPACTLLVWIGLDAIRGAR